MRSGVTNIFKWPSLFHQLGQTMLHYTGCPLVDFTLVIISTTNKILNTLGHTDEDVDINIISHCIIAKLKVHA